MRSFAKTHTGAQSGVVAAAALACLFLTVLISAGLAASVLQRHRQSQRQAREAQAVWLAESAARRGAARLRMEPEYVGETWSIPASELGGRYSGKAVIVVSGDGADAGQRRIAVEAFYPDDPVHRTRVTKEIAAPAARPAGDRE
jgi:hypothetical protein